MADEERRINHKKQTAKSKGKPKSRWRKPANLPNIGNKEKGESFSFYFSTPEAGNWDKYIILCEACVCML